jgi:hypothetical protein
MLNDNIIANYIAVISAFASIFSAFLAFLAYRKSVKHYKKNNRDLSFANWRKNLDDCYTELTGFIGNYSKSSESNKKRIAREKILYLLEVYRPDIDESKYIGSNVKTDYGDISIKISDITYADNFEKIISDLGIIKSSISKLKHLLIEA